MRGAEVSLAPCPFCGWRAEVRDSSAEEEALAGVWIECVDCGARSASTDVRLGIRNGVEQAIAEAAAAWNRRASADG